jgi:hypothetical protein
MIDTDLTLTPTEVAGLWTSITATIHPDYFNTVAWYKNGSKTSRTIHDHLREASILLVAKFVHQVTFGPPNTRHISATSRCKYLIDMTSRMESIPQWPLPAPDIPMLSDRNAWENQPLHYFTGYTSSGYFSVLEKLTSFCPTSVLRATTNRPSTSDSVQPTATNSHSSPCSENDFQPLSESPATPISRKTNPTAESEVVEPLQL